jgi:metal-responsive CopG/Arc/MetJ family transcriptional regulator
MAQITATITDDVVKKIDISASEQGISRSKWVALAIDAFLVSGNRDVDPVSEYMGSDVSSGTSSPDSPHEHMVSGQSEVYMEREHMKEEVQRLMHEVEGKNQVIRLQSDEISWLRGECAKMTDRMIVALPPPRQHWWEFWRQKS